MGARSKYLKSEIKTTKTERSDEAIDSNCRPTPTRLAPPFSLPPFPFHDPKAANKLLSFGRLGDSTLCLMNGIYNRRGGVGGFGARLRELPHARLRRVGPHPAAAAQSLPKRCGWKVLMAAIDAQHCVHRRGASGRTQPLLGHCAIGT